MQKQNFSFPIASKQKNLRLIARKQKYEGYSYLNASTPFSK